MDVKMGDVVDSRRDMTFRVPVHKRPLEGHIGTSGGLAWQLQNPLVPYGTLGGLIHDAIAVSIEAMMKVRTAGQGAQSAR
jgi:hypothetical protein